MRAALLAVLLLAAAVPALAAPRTLAFPTLYGEYRLAFDDARLAPADVERLVVLSPYLAGWSSLAVAPRLERCVVGDPAYLDCRPRSTDSPGFLLNARVNLDRGAATARRLAELTAPPELAPVLAWLRRSLALSLWLEETKLDFYRSGDVAVLRRRYESADPARGCAGVIAGIAAAASRAAQYDLVVLDWHNCVNDLARRGLGDYPLEAWRGFLASWGISETLVDMTPEAAAGRR